MRGVDGVADVCCGCGGIAAVVKDEAVVTVGCVHRPGDRMLRKGEAVVKTERQHVVQFVHVIVQKRGHFDAPTGGVRGIGRLFQSRVAGQVVALEGDQGVCVHRDEVGIVIARELKVFQVQPDIGKGRVGAPSSVVAADQRAAHHVGLQGGCVAVVAAGTRGFVAARDADDHRLLCAVVQSWHFQDGVCTGWILQRAIDAKDTARHQNAPARL